VNWGSAAWDPERSLLVMAHARSAMVQRLVPREELERTASNPPFEILFPQEGAPYGLLQSVFVSSWGIPCTKPPWGELLALDVARGDVAWRVPFGTTRGLAPWPFWFDWGLPAMGGPALTASGVLFIGAAMDGYFRAYDVTTGKELWRDHLPAGGQANPMTYRVRADGRQFVVIAAGGHGSLGTTKGDYTPCMRTIVAYGSALAFALHPALRVAAEPTHAERLTGTAAALHAALPDEARWSFGDAEREDIHFAPFGIDGAKHGELPDEAASLAEELLALSLGPRGMDTARLIRRNELAVAAADRWLPGFLVRRFRDPGRYYVALFGEPAATAPWGFRYEGHHLSVNLTVAPGRAPASTPLFLGAQPRIVPAGLPDAGARALGAEEDAARALVAALPPALRERATLHYESGRDLMRGQVARVAAEPPSGVRRGEAPPAAQVHYDTLVALFTTQLAAPIAHARIAEIEAAGRDALHFVWADAEEPPGAFYFRLEGPRTLIEVDNTTDGDHVHAVWHDPVGDFGDAPRAAGARESLLARHWREAHGGRP